VVAPSCTVAGILTTSAFVLGPQDGYHLINGFHGASGAMVTTGETSSLQDSMNTWYNKTKLAAALAGLLVTTTVAVAAQPKPGDPFRISPGSASKAPCRSSRQGRDR